MTLRQSIMAGYSRRMDAIAGDTLGYRLRKAVEDVQRARQEFAWVTNPKSDHYEQFVAIINRWVAWQRDHEILERAPLYRNEIRPSAGNFDFARTAENPMLLTFSWRSRGADPNDEPSIAQIPAAYFFDPTAWEAAAIASGDYREDSRASEQEAEKIAHARALLEEHGFTVTGDPS